MDLHFTLNPCVMSKKFKRVSDWSTAVSGSGTLNVTMYGGGMDKSNEYDMCYIFYTTLPKYLQCWLASHDYRSKYSSGSMYLICHPKYSIIC